MSVRYLCRRRAINTFSIYYLQSSCLTFMNQKACDTPNQVRENHWAPEITLKNRAICCPVKARM